MSEVKTRFHSDNDGKDLVVERVQDVEPVLRDVERLRRTGAGRSKSNELHHAARFPRVAVEHYCNQHGITLREWMQDPVHVDRMLKDPDLSKFRVVEGKRYI